MFGDFALVDFVLQLQRALRHLATQERDPCGREGQGDEQDTNYR